MTRFIDHTNTTPKPKRDYVKDHARRTLRKAGLTKEQAARFVKNFQPSFGHVEPLSAFSRSIPGGRTASKAVAEGFSWEASPEGWGYWSDVKETLAGKEHVA